MQEPEIPSSYHTFMRLIMRFQEEAPDASRKVLKRRIMNLLDLPLEMDDPYWDEEEFSYLRSRSDTSAAVRRPVSTWRCIQDYGKKESKS